MKRLDRCGRTLAMLVTASGRNTTRELAQEELAQEELAQEELRRAVRYGENVAG